MNKGTDYTGISVVFLCHDGEGNYLVSKRTTQCRDEHGTWDQGGGGLKFGEKVEDAVRREIGEEFCTDVIDMEFLGFRDVHREHEGNKTHWVALDYRVHIDRTKVQNGEPHKCEELRWVTLDTIPEPTHSQLPTFLSQHKGKL